MVFFCCRQPPTACSTPRRRETRWGVTAVSLARFDHVRGATGGPGPRCSPARAWSTRSGSRKRPEVFTPVSRRLRAGGSHRLAPRATVACCGRGVPRWRGSHIASPQEPRSHRWYMVVYSGRPLECTAHLCHTRRRKGPRRRDCQWARGSDDVHQRPTECTMRAFLVGDPPTMPTDPADLEFTADEMRRMGHATVERLVDHVLSLETQPARGDVDAADLCRRLREPAPERGVAYEPLLDRLLDRVGAAVVHVVGARLSRLHPGRRAVSRGAGGPDRRRGQSLHRGAAGGAGARAARGQRARLAARLDGLSRRDPRAVHDRRVDGALQRRALRARAASRSRTSARAWCTARRRCTTR